MNNKPAAFTGAASEEELTKTARSCLCSKEKVSFVVGPTRAGKSTQLPRLMAKEAGNRVICVQPDGEIARRHAEYVAGDKTTSVGSCDDSADIPPGFRPKNGVTYMSYKWLYRLILAAKGEKWQSSSEAAKPEEMVGAVILDEVHAQTMVQELGYIGVNNVFHGPLKNFPPGWSPETKIVMTTAYPHADPFSKVFRLSREQIGRQTINISVNEGGNRAGAIEATYLEDDQKFSVAGYHHIAKSIVESILKGNPKANILVMSFSGAHTRRNLVSDMKPSSGARVFDLSECNVGDVNSSGPDGRVVVATPDYASSIPVHGITDIICTHERFVDSYDENLFKNITRPAVLMRWEMDFIKNHLDPERGPGRIHNAFRRAAEELIYESKVGVPRFTDTDCVEYWLGIARLVGISRSQVPETPLRYAPPRPIFARAMRQLERLGFLHLRYGAYNVTHSSRILLTLNLMDHTGLAYREALFLAEMAVNIQEKKLSRKDGDTLLLISILLVVFDRDPVLTKITLTDMKPIDVLGFVNHLRIYVGVMSDAWINAAFWMNTIRKFNDEGLDALAIKNSLNWRVDAKMFAGARAKISRLARYLEIDNENVVDLYDFSLLGRVKTWMDSHDAPIHWFETNPFVSYQKAYMYNVMWIETEAIMQSREAFAGLDTSTLRNVSVDLKNTALNFLEEARGADMEQATGLYVCASRYVYREGKVMAQGFTILSPQVIRSMIPQGENLRVLLRLN
ncbi:hypothetical protein GGR53DRAFT_235065 [Hypoxylon sp. FL1150]|nr:hypothetical protein GGR53DRAFT_235065 [Hypoxylon sp. FL1150]